MATSTNAPGAAIPAGRKDHDQAARSLERTRRSRELSDEAVRHQAEALADFVSRGGSPSCWLETKDLVPADRAAILVALGDRSSDQVANWRPEIGQTPRHLADGQCSIPRRRSIPRLTLINLLVRMGWWCWDRAEDLR